MTNFSISLSPLVLIFSAAFLVPRLVPASSKAESYCDYREALLGGILKRGQTPLSWSEKKPKPPRPQWKVARRRGLEPVLTTLFSIHSKEAIPIFKNRRPPSMILDRFFRCRGFGTASRLNTRLVDAIFAAAAHFEAPRVEVISAFRSPKFNDSLNKKGRNVSVESRHTRGEAIDFRLPKILPEILGEWLWEQFDGGVGTYQADGFIHLDVGPKRKWNGR